MIGVVARRVVVGDEDLLLAAGGDGEDRVVERLGVDVDAAGDERVERRDVVGEERQLDVEAGLLEDALLLGDGEGEPARPGAVADLERSARRSPPVAARRRPRSARPSDASSPPRPQRAAVRPPASSRRAVAAPTRRRPRDRRHGRAGITAPCGIGQPCIRILLTIVRPRPDRPTRDRRDRLFRLRFVRGERAVTFRSGFESSVASQRASAADLGQRRRAGAAGRRRRGRRAPRRSPGSRIGRLSWRNQFCTASSLDMIVSAARRASTVAERPSAIPSRTIAGQASLQRARSFQ